MMKFSPRVCSLIPTSVFLASLLGSSAGIAATTLTGSSQYVTLNCTSGPCPWGSTLASDTVVWPDWTDPIDIRLGYTGEQPFSLTSTHANGADVTVTSGAVTLYAWVPTTTMQRVLTTMIAGDSYRVLGLQGGEVLTILGNSGFGYRIDLLTEPEPDPEPGPDPEPDPEPDPDPNAGPETSIDGFSTFITLDCSGSLPCPFGPQLNTHAVVWPDWTNPISYRLGYSGPNGASLPSAYANGGTFSVVSGSAGLRAWRPDSAESRMLATLGPGQSYEISDLEPGEVFTVLSPFSFQYSAELPEPPAPLDGEHMDSVAAYWRCNIPSCNGPDWEGAVLNWPSWAAYSDNLREGAGSRTVYGEHMDSVAAYWRCNIPSCNGPDWEGAVLTWPSWAAYSDNLREGAGSRTVYGEDGGLLHPYVGAWAHGCEITVDDGTVWVIEWQRGEETWDLTIIGPGDTHVVNIESPHDGALIEGFHGFSVTINNCTPQPVP